MPITKSAKKALRVDRTRQSVNKSVLKSMKTAIKKVGSKPSKEGLARAYSFIDKASKNGVIKKNRAARLKSRLVSSLKKSFKSSPFGA